MKKLLSLFALLMTIVIGAKADGYPTYQLIEDAAINSADFHTAGTLSDGTEISGFSKYVLMTGNVTGTASLCENTKYIAYDVKSTKTVFTVRVYNKNSSAKNLLIHDCKEVLNSSSKATTSMETLSVASKTTTDEATTKTYTTENTGKATIYFSVASSDIHFYQIIAEEQGDALTNTTPGVGYSLNLKYGRIAAKSAVASTFDGIEFCPSSDYKPTNNSELKLKTFGTNYVKFTLAERAALKLKVTSGVKYTLGTAKDVAGEVEYGGSAGTYTTVLEAGTWFINPIDGNTSDFKIENISFDPVYAVNFEAGEGGSGTMTSKYYAEDQTVTVPTCSFTHETKVFDKWSVEGVEGKTEAVADDEFTMPSNTVTLTALWRTAAAKHSVTYDINGGTGDTPTQVDVEENANFTVAGTDGFTAPAGKEFKCWNDGTNDYNPGATYNVGTSDVTLTAVYQDKTYKGLTPTGTLDFANPGSTFSSTWYTSEGKCVKNFSYDAPNGIAVMSAYAIYQGKNNQIIDWTDNDASGSSKQSWDATGVFQGGNYYFASEQRCAAIMQTERVQYYRVKSITSVSALFGGKAAMEAYEVNAGVVSPDPVKTTSVNTGTASISDLDESKEYIILVRGNDGTNQVKYYEIAFTFPAISKETVTIPSEGFATYVTSSALDFSSQNGAFKAYIVSNVTETSAQTVEVTQVPAGTALLLKGAASSYDVDIIASAAEVTNLLKASNGGVKGDNSTIFAYSKANAKFVKVAQDLAIPAGKAYLKITTPNAGDALDIDFDGATAINNVNANDNANSAAPVKVVKNGQLFIGNYNVAGARIK